MKSSPLLKQAAKFYSRKLYSFFEEEFLHGLGGLNIEHSSSDLSRFYVKNIDNSTDSHNWIVNFNSLEGIIQCSCAKFEMMGILYSHCMRVMRQLDIVNIPVKYLLPRWSANARKDLYSGGNISCLGINACQPIEGSNNLMFINYICRFAYKISTEAQDNEKVKMCVIDGLSTLAAKVHSIKIDRKNKLISRAGNDSIKDPKKCRPNGVLNARLKDH
ncbi:Protein FAR1-RELATED SEQUENCE 9 [Dendrobium catenatum]|uniref:Protein FAR1-RELATED SEQUENCE n=1 Tax=Dendrobium catenatum TaxID=906689 RepID=A0A2I0V9D4_9ASPA|nr:Protein FAR1-RELATED SEQUENCE 9 [Dendrobium catenatum]